MKKVEKIWAELSAKNTQEVELRATVSCLQTETLRRSETIRDLQLQVYTQTYDVYLLGQRG